MSTIFAISSGQPPAAIAILRVSGPAARAVAETVAGSVPPPREAVVRRLRDRDDATLDRALVLWFPAPASATGEDCVEFHLHGGRAVVAAVEAAVAVVPGVRRALPGEFTRRALANGRIDLTQATGLADLLEAETEGERRAAMAAAEGGLGKDVRNWLDRLSDIRARIEAAIDYDEEGDVAVDAKPVLAMAAVLGDEIGAVLDRPRVERIRQGSRVVLAGPPNSGKSSLFNALLGDDAAIVSPIAGTTRDRIERTVHREGRTITLVDTAGLAETTDDVIERAGIARSHVAIETADVVVWLDDLPPPSGVAQRLIWPIARADLPGREAVADRLAVSCKRPASVARLWKEIAARCETILVQPEGYLLHDYQHEVLSAARDAIAASAGQTDTLIAAEMLRVAARDLARLTGVDETEKMLDALFSRFCLGK